MLEHKETKVLPYTPEQIFQLVSDVKSYPEFLPWCLAARILSEEKEKIIADLMIGYGMFRGTFRSDVSLTPFKKVEVSYVEGDLEQLHNFWEFEPHPEGVQVTFYVGFSFKNSLLQNVITPIFSSVTEKMIEAFEARADALFKK